MWIVWLAAALLAACGSRGDGGEMQLELERVSATIDGAPVAAKSTTGAIPMIRRPRDYVSYSRSPAMGPAEALRFSDAVPLHRVYLLYDEVEVLVRPDRTEATVTIGLALKLATGGPSVRSLEVDGRRIPVDPSGATRFEVRRTIRAVEREHVAAHPKGWKIHVIPEGLYGEHPERFGVEPIRVRFPPARGELEIRWRPLVDETNHG